MPNILGGNGARMICRLRRLSTAGQRTQFDGGEISSESPGGGFVKQATKRAATASETASVPMKPHGTFWNGMEAGDALGNIATSEHVKHLNGSLILMFSAAKHSS